MYYRETSLCISWIILCYCDILVFYIAVIILYLSAGGYKCRLTTFHTRFAHIVSVLRKQPSTSHLSYHPSPLFPYTISFKAHPFLLPLVTSGQSGGELLKLHQRGLGRNQFTVYWVCLKRKNNPFSGVANRIFVTFKIPLKIVNLCPPPILRSQS